MSRLTRSEIETLIDDLIVAHPIYTPQLRALRDQSLSQEAVRWKCGLCGGLIVNGRCSQCNFDYRPAAPKRQESVRDEALEPLADNERNADIEDFRKAVTYFRMTGKVPQGYSQAVFTEQVGDFALRYIRAVLKREPNAALGMEHPNDAGAGPAPAAPNVASMVKDYPNLYMMLHGAVSGHYTEWPLMRKELTALLTRLGQEWIPPTEQQEAEDMRDILERQRKRNRLGASDE